MKISFITHLSYEHPLLMKEFLSGLSETLDENVEIKKNFTGAEISTKDFADKVQTIALTEEFDLLIIYTSYYRIINLWEMLDKTGEKVIFINDGFYNYTSDELEPKKNISSISLEMAECSYQLGLYAKENFYGKLGVVSDFINSGFQGSFYFIEGFVKPKEAPLFQQVVPHGATEGEYKQTIKQQLLATKPEVLFLNAGSKVGNAILSLKSDAEVMEKLPTLKWVIGNELLIELIDLSDSWDENLVSCSTLAPRSELEEKWQSKMKGKTSTFYALGYEVGIAAMQVLEENQQGFESLRGKIEWNSKERRYKAKPKVLISRNNSVISQKVEEAGSFPTLENFGGWENAYLCY